MAKVYSRSGLPKNRFHFVALALVTISGLLQATQVAAADPLGNWRLSSGKITVRVSYCGGTNICASIVGMAQPLTKQGTPKIDKDNPNPALRNRRIIGLQVVNGMTPEGENRCSSKVATKPTVHKNLQLAEHRLSKVVNNQIVHKTREATNEIIPTDKAVDRDKTVTDPTEVADKEASNKIKILAITAGRKNNLVLK